MAATTNNMTVGSPMRAILRFALPLIAGYLLQQAYSVIDAAIVGKLLGVSSLAAIGASSSIIFLIMGFCNGTSSGFAIPVAQAFGAGDETHMRSFVANAVRLSILLAVIMTALTSALTAPILRMVNTPDDIMREATIYLLVNFLAIPFTVAYNLLSGMIRALGNSRTPFLFLIVSSVVNIVLDLVMIIVFKMGVGGAAFATLLSQAVSAALCYRYIRRNMQMLVPKGRGERRFSRKDSGILLWNGVPMGLQFSITAIGSIMLQGANNALGTSYVAAFTSGTRIKYLFTTVFENIGVAMATYCGQNIGAGKMVRVRQGIVAAMKITMVYFAITMLVIMPFADEMMLLFMDRGETEIIANAAKYLRVIACFFPALGTLTVLRYSIQGLGYANLSLFSGVAEMLARCAISLWMVPALGFAGVILGDPTAWISADLFLVPCIIVLYRRLSDKV